MFLYLIIILHLLRSNALQYDVSNFLKKNLVCKTLLKLERFLTQCINSLSKASNILIRKLSKAFAIKPGVIFSESGIVLLKWSCSLRVALFAGMLSTNAASNVRNSKDYCRLFGLINHVMFGNHLKLWEFFFWWTLKGVNSKQTS